MNVIQDCASGTFQSASVEVQVEVQSNADSRWDIGFYIGLDGLSAAAQLAQQLPSCRTLILTSLGKPSLTRWRLAPDPAPVPGSTRLELEPVTGRSHQLRVHLMAIGFPIVGDPLYATEAQEAMAPRLLLHAQAIEIPHPATDQPMRFEAPCPF